MSIFDKIRALNLPELNYLVVGSGVMEARGVRSSNDLDLLVTSYLFEELKNDPSWQLVYTNDGTNRQVLTRGNVEVYAAFRCGRYQRTFDELIVIADTINGIPFLPLTELLLFKQELGREKDLRDIELIQKYLDCQE